VREGAILCSARASEIIGDMDDDLQRRFDAISVPELRRRVDLAVRRLRELRNSLAVHAGMVLESAPGPLPALDRELAERELQELMKMLPLLRQPLTPKERAELRPPSAAQRERMKEVLDELAAHPGELAELAKETDIDLSPERIAALREGIEKTEMLGEVQREAQAFSVELKAYKQQMEEALAELAEKITRKGGQAS
jgi:hypothetical protein